MIPKTLDWTLALPELQADLEDAAIDLGCLYAGGNRSLSMAEARFNEASEKLRRGIALALGEK
jgi:hypothetical protein